MQLLSLCVLLQYDCSLVLVIVVKVCVCLWHMGNGGVALLVLERRQQETSYRGTKTVAICWWEERGLRCLGLATLHFTPNQDCCGHCCCVHKQLASTTPVSLSAVVRVLVAMLLVTNSCCMQFCSMCRTVYSSSPCTSLTFIEALSFYWLQIACKTWRRRCRKGKG